MIGLMDDTHLVFDPQVFLTCRASEQRVDIFERHIRSFRNPVRSPDIGSETR